jgi:signal transduction histidine kinase
MTRTRLPRNLLERSGGSPVDEMWARTLAAAASAATLDAALAATITAALPDAEIQAAAVGECNPPHVHAVVNCGLAEAAAILAREEVAAASTAGEGSAVHLDLADLGGFPPLGAGAEHLVALPLHSSHLRRGFLLIFHRGPLSAGQRERTVALAALVSLLLEREFHAQEAHRAREARTHFLVAIHHELRTPATALMLEGGLLQSGLLGPLPPRLESSLNRMEAHVGELIRVVQRVLDLAQWETTTDSPAEDLLDVRKAVVALARQVEPTAERRGIKLSLFFPRLLPLLQTDSDRFRRILLFLLGNALKYTDQGFVQVRVERGLRSSGSNRREPQLVVRITDSGRGIPKEELERIFEPFAQVEEGARTDSQNRGLGLGLPLARKLARSLGGDIVVESSCGAGTTATLFIPYRSDHPG